MLQELLSSMMSDTLTSENHGYQFEILRQADGCIHNIHDIVIVITLEVDRPEEASV
jgi:hypothetical protein